MLEPWTLGGDRRPVGGRTGKSTVAKREPFVTDNPTIREPGMTTDRGTMSWFRSLKYYKALSLAGDPRGRTNVRLVSGGMPPSARAKHRPRSAEERRLRRLGWVWTFLFIDVLGSPSGGILGIPHIIGSAMTQGSLVVALVLALSLNPRVWVRPNWFLGLYSVLGITTLMMSVRFVTLGTAYRGFRLIGFLAVIWLITPWWGRLDLVLLRNQVRFVMLILCSVLLGLLLAPYQLSGGGRLGGVIWPIAATQVAHYAAELMGLTLLLWLCRMISRRSMLVVAVPSFLVLILTHTRTALLAALIGLLVAGLSLFTANRRVRQAFTAMIVVVAIGLPLSPFIANWLARGESSAELTSLTGRTNSWQLVIAEQRPETNKILGSGLSNDSVDGLAIDSSWFSVYQDQGLVGDALVAAMFLLLLLMAALRPRGPTRALALFLIVYCILASFTEDGAGIASQYALDLTIAASLLVTPLLPHRAEARPANSGSVNHDRVALARPSI